MAIIQGMANIQIVKLAPEDWQQYKRIRLEALKRDPQAFGSSLAETQQRPDSHWQERLGEALAGTKNWLLFAKEDDRIIGLIGAYRTAQQDVVEIYSVYVTQAGRRHGAATALMSSILQEVEKPGFFRKAVLSVTASQAAAIALYQKFGFQIVDTKTAVMGDEISHQGYIMEKWFAE